MVNRDTEFAPVKNANGDDPNVAVPDSPAHARKMMLQESANWLMNINGLKIDQAAMGQIAWNAFN